MADERIHRSACGPDPTMAALLGMGACLQALLPRQRASDEQLQRIACRMPFLADRSRRSAKGHFHVPPTRFRCGR